MDRDEGDGEERQTDRQTGPWVLALGVLAVGVGAVVREVRRNRGEKPRQNRAEEVRGVSDEDDA
ncbi:hypothetical protein [Haladaptatus sp. NG-SE-30]